MGEIGSVKSRRLFAALYAMGFAVRAKPKGSHRLMFHPDGRVILFAFHDKETVGPKMLSKILKDIGVDYATLKKYL